MFAIIVTFLIIIMLPWAKSSNSVRTGRRIQDVVHSNVNEEQKRHTRWVIPLHWSTSWGFTEPHRQLPSYEIKDIAWEELCSFIYITSNLLWLNSLRGKMLL